MFMDEVKPSVPELTDRQLQCLEGYWNRRPAKQIAAELGISEAGVHKNLGAARRKLHVTSSADAAAIVFGAKPGGIKSYYYRETNLPLLHNQPDQALAAKEAQTLSTATSERALINRFGVGQTIGLILAVAVGLLAGLVLMLQSAVGFQQLWNALAH